MQLGEGQNMSFFRHWFEGRGGREGGEEGGVRFLSIFYKVIHCIIIIIIQKRVN